MIFIEGVLLKFPVRNQRQIWYVKPGSASLGCMIMQGSFAFCFAMQTHYQHKAPQRGMKYLTFGIYPLPFALLCGLIDL